MTPALLTRISTALYGPHYQRQLAHAVDVRIDTVADWVNGREAVPPGVRDELRAMLAERRGEINNLIVELNGTSNPSTMNIVLAIKRYRTETGVTLKEAKDYVYAHPEYI